MTTLGWDHPPSVPAPALDHNGEPLGYGLSSDLTYEQPPMLIAQVDGPQPTGALPTTQASAGFVISLVGWPRLLTFPVLTMPLIATGVVLSASTLTNCRRGVSAGRKRAGGVRTRYRRDLCHADSHPGLHQWHPDTRSSAVSAPPATLKRTRRGR